MTIPKQTERAIKQRQKRDFCADCERYKAFCTGRRIWFNEDNDDEYWVCEECIDSGRPKQEEEENEQQTILAFIGGDSR